MSRGAHFALSSEHLAALEVQIEARQIDYLIEDLTSQFAGDPTVFFLESEESWELIHHALKETDDVMGGSDFPLSHLLLGGKMLHEDDDLLVSMKTPAEVKIVAAAISAIDEGEFLDRYLALDPDATGLDVTLRNAEYAWYWFSEIREFWRRAEAAGLAAVFIAEQ